MKDTSLYCQKRSCDPILSPFSSSCKVPRTRAPVHRFEWVISSRKLAPSYPLQVLVVNNQAMVSLTAAVGDRIALRVKNSLKEPVALHFHGVPQHGTRTLFDGLASNLQRAIKPDGEGVTAPGRVPSTQNAVSAITALLMVCAASAQPMTYIPSHSVVVVLQQPTRTTWLLALLAVICGAAASGTKLPAAFGAH